jgi:hypothetical protein
MLAVLAIPNKLDNPADALIPVSEVRTVPLAVPALAGMGADDCWACGGTSHEWISGSAIEELPQTLPAFVRTPAADARFRARPPAPCRPG